MVYNAQQLKNLLEAKGIDTYGLEKQELEELARGHGLLATSLTEPPRVPLTVHDLKRLFEQHGVDFSMCYEKSELEELALITGLI